MLRVGDSTGDSSSWTVCKQLVAGTSDACRSSSSLAESGSNQQEAFWLGLASTAGWCVSLLITVAMHPGMSYRHKASMGVCTSQRGKPVQLCTGRVTEPECVECFDHHMNVACHGWGTCWGRLSCLVCHWQPRQPGRQPRAVLTG